MDCTAAGADSIENIATIQKLVDCSLRGQAIKT